MAWRVLFSFLYCCISYWNWKIYQRKIDQCSWFATVMSDIWGKAIFILQSILLDKNMKNTPKGKMISSISFSFHGRVKTGLFKRLNWNPFDNIFVNTCAYVHCLKSVIWGRCFWGGGVTRWICKWCLFNWLITRTVHLSPHSNPLSVVSFQISLIALHRARNNVYKDMFVEWTCLACLNLHRCACILRACLWLYRQREGMWPIYMTLIKI